MRQPSEIPWGAFLRVTIPFVKNLPFRAFLIVFPGTVIQVAAAPERQLFAFLDGGCPVVAEDGRGAAVTITFPWEYLERLPDGNLGPGV